MRKIVVLEEFVEHKEEVLLAFDTALKLLKTNPNPRYHLSRVEALIYDLKRTMPYLYGEPKLFLIMAHYLYKDYDMDKRYLGKAIGEIIEKYKDKEANLVREKIQRFLASLHIALKQLGKMTVKEREELEKNLDWEKASEIILSAFKVEEKDKKVRLVYN